MIDLSRTTPPTIDVPVVADHEIIDTHVHLWPRGLVHPAQTAAVPLPSTAVDLIGSLDAAGVKGAVVSPAAVFHDNRYILRAAGSRPDRIFPVIGVDTRDATAIANIAELARRGAIGLRPRMGSEPPGPEDVAGVDRLIDASTSLGLAFQWTISLSSAFLIEQVAARVPSTRQVLDHLGRPEDVRDCEALARLRELAEIPRLHIKLSGMYSLSKAGYPYEDTWPWVETALDLFGPERTMWASDWPLVCESTTYADQLALVARMPFIDRSARQDILGRTAKRFWGIGVGVR